MKCQINVKWGGGVYNFKIKKFKDFDIYYRYSQTILNCEHKKSDEQRFIERMGDIVTIIPSEEIQQINKARSNRRTKDKIYDYACSNDWTNGYFMTVTFNKEYLDRYNYQECYSKLKSYLDNLRKYNHDMKYLFVCEQHKDGAYHFHGLIKDANLKLTKFDDFIYNVDNFKWGFTTVTIVKDTLAVSKYITKYITKEMNLPKGSRKYLVSKNLNTPIVETHLIRYDDIIIDEFDYYSKVENQYNCIDIYYKNHTSHN